MSQCAEFLGKSWKDCEFSITECRCSLNDIEHVLDVLQHHQDWRRGADTEMIHPTIIGLVIDSAILHLKDKNSASAKSS